MDILSDKKVKTRKDHQCMCCLRMMPKGSIMRVQVNNFDGLQRFRWCETCETLCSRYKDHFFDESEGMFLADCVKEVMLDYEVGSPEELLKILDNEKHTI